MAVIHAFVGPQNTEVVNDSTFAVIFKMEGGAHQIERIEHQLQSMGYKGLIIKVGPDADLSCLDEKEMNRHGWYKR